ncbi:MAG: hypothetical protein NWQ06_06410 [Leeuwenhoekiella sp.]|nr:hypothetical protein [Leeuwenhoekiella sp.]
MNLAAAKYRITYEAFSKFSGGLSKVENLENLSHVVSKHLKYLFNFKIFRILLIDKSNVTGYTFAKGQTWISKNGEDVLTFENKLLKEQIPFSNAINDSDLPKYLNHITLDNGQLWGWYIPYSDYEVCVSLVSDDSAQFSLSDVEILHLLVDTLTSKYRQICLNQEINLKNQRLEDAVAQIALKNKEIEKINSNQQSIIDSRTRELRIKNKKILELLRLNAHELREPLCRILGLLEISDYYTDTELRNEILPKLAESSFELDSIFKSVVIKSEEEIKKYSYNYNDQL